MFEIFPVFQWLIVIIVGLTIGAFGLGYLVQRPLWLLMVTGEVFFISRVPFELERVDRVLGAAILWLVFVLAIWFSDKIAHRKYGA